MSLNNCTAIKLAIYIIESTIIYISMLGVNLELVFSIGISVAGNVSYHVLTGPLSLYYVTTAVMML